MEKLNYEYSATSNKIERNIASDRENQDFPTVTFYLGNCYFKQKKYEKAIQFFKLEGGKDEWQTGQRLNNLGTCYAKRQ